MAHCYFSNTADLRPTDLALEPLDFGGIMGDRVEHVGIEGLEHMLESHHVSEDTAI